MTIALLIVIPLAGCLAVLAFRSPPMNRAVALASTLGTAALAALAVREYLASGAPLTFALSGTVGSFVRLSADGIALPLVALTAVLSVVAILVSWNAERLNAHLALLLALEAAVLAVFLAADLVLFYVAWEAVLIPMFFLIGGWGHEGRRLAAMKFFVYTFAGSALMLIALVILVLAQGGHEMVPAGTVALGPQEQLVFWLLALGFLVKIPVWPLHTWLPDAHVEAPTSGSLMLAGVLLKMGGYGILRLCIPYAPNAFSEAAPLLAVLGGIGIVYGAAVALGQSDLKRLVAYSSVAHMGFVVLGLASGTELGMQGAMLAMVSHGVVAALLFLLVGSLYDRSHTREMSAFGGLGTSMPKWATVFVFACLASLGLPGLSGFPGEFAAVTGSFVRFGWPVALVGLGVVLAGAYNLRAIRTVVHGERAEPGAGGSPSSEMGGAKHLSDLVPRELLAIAPLAILIVLLGVWPRIVTDLAGSSIADLLATLAGAR
ncbi:MAG: NADH-quinone oxidoreductase subunit M [Coriobacteriia bacterium]|nr:NADH-quinone oxidoreductase subunit M [Coriobacteriia bacterium]